MTEGGLEVIGSSGALVRLAEAYLRTRSGERTVVAGVDADAVPSPGITIIDRTTGRWAFIAVPESESWVEPALQAAAAGASGVIALTSSESDLDGLVESVSTGNFYIAPEVATRIIRAPVEKTLQPPTERSLTLRERQVVQLVAEGLTNAEIGSRLSISVNTVRAHVRSLALKIEASSRTKIQTRARALGLVHPDRTATTRDEWNKKDARRG